MTLAPELHTRRPRSAVLAYLSCVRYPEVLVLQGAPLLGVAFALPRSGAGQIPSVAVFALASLLLVAHVWTFNDWAGVTTDLNDPSRSGGVFSTKGVISLGLLLFSLGLLLASLILFTLLSRRTLLLALAIAALGVLYSHPAVSAKGIPIVSSGPHLVGGVLHFLLGYSLFEAIDRRGVLIALFFALTFTAGHLNQEVRDYEPDRRNGLRTNAVVFGKTRSFLASFVLFTLAYANLTLLAYGGVVPAPLGVLALVLYPVHLAWSVSALRAGLSFESVSRLQNRYRLLYGLIGLCMITALLYR